MKRIGLLVSILFHLILLMILLNIQFSVPVHPLVPETIAIVPMYPPLKYYPPQPIAGRPSGKDAPIVIQPFFIPARPGPKGEGGGGGSKPGTQGEPSGQSGAGGGGPPTIPARSGGGAGGGSIQPNPVEPKPDGAPQNPRNSRLRIDWDAIARSLGGSGGTGSPAPFSSSEKPTALPFGNRWQSGAGSGSGGGDNVAAFGGNAFFDSRGYDITPWAKRMVYRIKRNWIYPPAVDYGLRGQVEIYVVIEKNGAISTLALAKSSMIQPFDQSAINAMRLSIPLPSLPPDFPNRDLPAYFIFRFN